MCTKPSMEDELPINQPQKPTEYILERLEKLGPIPSDLQIRILTEKNLTVLRTWYNQAANAESLEQFIQEM